VLGWTRIRFSTAQQPRADGQGQSDDEMRGLGQGGPVELVVFGEIGTRADASPPWPRAIISGGK
jgi:hypothetical protein